MVYLSDVSTKHMLLPPLQRLMLLESMYQTSTTNSLPSKLSKRKRREKESSLRPRKRLDLKLALSTGSSFILRVFRVVSSFDMNRNPGEDGTSIREKRVTEGCWCSIDEEHWSCSWLEGLFGFKVFIEVRHETPWACLLEELFRKWTIYQLFAPCYWSTLCLSILFVIMIRVSKNFYIISDACAILQILLDAANISNNIDLKVFLFCFVYALTML